MTKSIVSALLLLLTSCGYHFVTTTADEHAKTVTVPAIDGDKDGSLAMNVIHELTRGSNFRYTKHQSDYILQIEVLGHRLEDIGFRYDINTRGTATRNLVPTESRENFLVEVTLVDRASNKPILGPTRILTKVDYDHDYYLNKGALNTFSLGQVNDIETTEDLLPIPLERNVARRIISFLNYSM